MKKTKIILVILVLCITLFLSACTVQERHTSIENVEKKAVQQNMKEMQNQVGMPFIDDFFEKKMAKQIFELRDDAKLITHAYMVNLDGKYVYLGKCIGFGLPYSVQYTNPDKIVDVEDFGINSYQANDGMVISQADPNGLYMPDGLSATWLMLINEDTGEPEIIYTEPSIVVTQSKLPKRLVEPWSLPGDY